MDQTYNKKEKLRQLLFILIPILITQLAMYSMTFIDTLMTGRYSSDDLAGVAIGSSLWVPVFTGLSGILLAVTPIVSHLVGAKKQGNVAFSVIQGVYLSVIMALIVFAAGAFSLTPILNGMSLESRVHETAFDYLAALSTGLIPLFAYNVLRSFIDALGKTRVSMIITLISLPINVVFNYLFIYGKFGFPELGGAGAGFASAITYWLITLISFYIIHKHTPFSSYGVFRKLHAVSLAKWKEILLIGIPIGLSIFFETSIFSAVTLLMSNFETKVIAAHQIALNFASLLYMIPLSISMALTIVVGFEVGAARYGDAKEYSWIGVVIAVLMALVCAAILLLFPEEVASIYTKDANVLKLTAHFLIYALFFQLSDAIQAPVQGALRGYKDVNVTFIMSLISYWVIGLPFGYYLANYTSWGAYGYWIGLITGLAAGAITLTSRLIYIQKRKFPAGLQKNS
ncbi:MATE family multidrug resistance protein [Cytobacillus oceanisediminis]|jgi:MATE family multidrug resistance protein|uniref:Probable multidrug resistance protein NorM n=1 Tax=Cytobacillus oceanisediminis TaxID=665099 RepID=A0A2V3A2M6_9BACI|nr:MATE family efflux transporter [Cytobacillus oceanisediminis]PWW30170.1 MATE family multidrug resistance protein [Cytobacillus oceanisediminis]